MKEFLKGHQGDVQFAQVDKIPGKAKKIGNKPIAYGEHSGHQHVLTGDVEMFEVDGRMIAAVGSDGARLQHIHESKMTKRAWKSTVEIEKAGHNSHLLPPGNYEFYIQNAFNPYSKLMEKVID
jgi:hypothetical protein